MPVSALIKKRPGVQTVKYSTRTKTSRHPVKDGNKLTCACLDSMNMYPTTLILLKRNIMSQLTIMAIK